MGNDTKAVYDRWFDRVVFESEKDAEILNSSSDEMRYVFCSDPLFDRYASMLGNLKEFVRNSIGSLMAGIIEYYGYVIDKPDSDRKWGQEDNPILCEKDDVRIGIFIEAAIEKYQVALKKYQLDKVYYTELFDESSHPMGVIELYPSCFIANAEKLIEELTSAEEAQNFKKQSEDFKERLRNTHGLRIIPIPTKKQLDKLADDFACGFESIFENVVAPVLRGLDRNLSGNRSDDNPPKFTEDEISLIKNRIMSNRLYEVIFGRQEFAKSFVASEWRYLNEQSYEALEQTGTVAGYLKSIEQFFWWILEMFAGESSGKSLSFPYHGKYDEGSTKYFYNGELHNSSIKNVQYKKWRVFPLNRETLKEHKSEITLGVMEYFLRYKCLNKGLYIHEIDDCDMPSSASFGSRFADLVKQFRTESRNDKLHKDNFVEKGKVEDIRGMTLAIIVLALGSINFGENGLRQLEEYRGGNGDSFFPEDEVSQYLDRLGKETKYPERATSKFLITRRLVRESNPYECRSDSKADSNRDCWMLSVEIDSNNSDQPKLEIIFASWRFNGSVATVSEIVANMLCKYIEDSGDAVPSFMKYDVRVIGFRCGNEESREIILVSDGLLRRASS